MWNDFSVFDYAGMQAETISITGHAGKPIHAYHARPMGAGPYPGLLLIPHMPGWDEMLRETAQRFAAHGYDVICPNIYEDYGDGKPAEPAMRARDSGMVPDADVMGDCEGALRFLHSRPTTNGKAGVIGMCSGGRHTFLAACTLDGIDAAVDCWGGNVMTPPEKLTPSCPKAPADLTQDLKCPLIGIFGNDDVFPPPAEVDALEDLLKQYGKTYEFYRYDGAAHGIWYYDKPCYRPVQAMDSQEKVFAFLDRWLK